METPLAAPDAPSIPRLPALVLIGLLVGPFLSMVDSSVVNVALVTIAHGLNTDLATAQWVVSGYLLALALSLPSSAFLAKRFGTRRIYMLSIMGFTIASLGCAFAPTITVLIVTRVVQGFCGAALVPLAMNILLNPNGVAHKGIPLSAGVLLFLAPALGPTIGGLVLRVGAWPVIFLINVPIGLLGLWGAAHISIDLAGRGDRLARFDPLGLFLIGAGLALTLYGTTAGAQAGWLALDVWPFWSGGVALLLIYLLYALIRSRHRVGPQVAAPSAVGAGPLPGFPGSGGDGLDAIIDTDLSATNPGGFGARCRIGVASPGARDRVWSGVGEYTDQQMGNPWLHPAGDDHSHSEYRFLAVLESDNSRLDDGVAIQWSWHSDRSHDSAVAHRHVARPDTSGVARWKHPVHRDGYAEWIGRYRVARDILPIPGSGAHQRGARRAWGARERLGSPRKRRETGIPAALRPLIGAAAIARVHDTILVMVLVVACGVIATLFVRTPA